MDRIKLVKTEGKTVLVISIDPEELEKLSNSLLPAGKNGTGEPYKGQQIGGWRII